MRKTSQLSWTMLGIIALILGACQAPDAHLAANRSSIKLSLALTAPAVASSGARLLLPNTSQIVATAVDTAGTDTQTVTANFTSGATTASLALGLITGDTYNVTINATNSSGTIIGTASSKIVATNGSTATFSLLTPLSARYQVSSLSPSPAGLTIPAQGSATLQFDLSDSLSVTLPLPTSSPTLESFYFQNLDGSAFVPATSTVSGSQTTYVVKPSDLSSGSTSFCLTDYNATSTADTPNNPNFQFTLDPTKITAFVYVLDNESTQAQIQIVPLDETTGALGTAVVKSLTTSISYTPQKFLVDRRNKRLYVIGTYSSSGYLDGYNISSDGSLTSIPGFPQSYSTFKAVTGTVPVAIGPNGYLYWSSYTGDNIMASSFDANGFLNFASVSTADSTNISTVLDMRYDPSVGYMIVTNSSSVTLDSFGSNGQLTPLANPGNPGPASASNFAYNPYGNGGYYSISGNANTLYSWQLGSSPSSKMNLQTTSVTASYTSGGFLVGNPSGYITYLAQVNGSYFYVTPYSIDPSSGALLAAQNVVSVNDGSLVGMALDPTNTNLLISGTRYLYAFPVASDGSVATTPASLSLSGGLKLLDLAVIRTK